MFASSKRMSRWVLPLVGLLVLAGCASAPPQDPDNICRIFDERPKWYKAARKAEKRWGLPPNVALAFVHKESSYVADARPPRKKLLGVVPWRRPTSAYGYAQATNEAWSDYLEEAGGWFSDRDDFADALDFIGWYNHRSHRKLRLNKADAYNLYIAYYVGHGGYARGKWRKSGPARSYAKVVSARAARYGGQLKSCRKQLDGGGWFGIG